MLYVTTNLCCKFSPYEVRLRLSVCEIPRPERRFWYNRHHPLPRISNEVHFNNILFEEHSSNSHNKMAQVIYLNKTEAALFPCRLCFLRVFPFLSLIYSIIFIFIKYFRTSNWNVNIQCIAKIQTNSSDGNKPIWTLSQIIWYNK